ncbi:unnamed protein product [Cunninghamella echinulata]
MTFFNKLMDKKPKTHSPKETTFPSLSSLLHKFNHSELSPPSNTTSENVEHMNVDSPGNNKRSMPWQELNKGNKLPRRSADTNTNGSDHVSLSGQTATSKQTPLNNNSNNNNNNNNSNTIMETTKPITTTTPTPQQQQRVNKPNTNNSGNYTSVYND